ncbi:uncharacterized protein PRCAT00001009001 [Priceomyces carsonii]|uniref:uncharacterized protein n=1 Tax=Priceomyces carsonii TaxID=28549 RepID=UPI002EDAA0D3|nr:unnamed protein product [Priceomyces carsonii]
MAFQLSFNSLSFILILVSFVFLLLATISSPVVDVFKLGSTDQYNYGVFGYCKVSSSSCPSATYPYSVSGVDSTKDWLFSSSVRDKLAKVFIICPIALGFNFLTLALIFISHFVDSFLVIVAIVLNFISFLATAVVTVIIILVFHPHVAWTGWILVGAAAANLFSMMFLFFTLRIASRGSDNESVVSTTDDLTEFDDKFKNIQVNTFQAPNKFGSGFDNASSISKDYEFKVKPSNDQVTKIASNSSLYNSNPQLMKDLTINDRPMNSSYAKGSESSSSYYEDANVNLKNGPSTPVATRQQMAPRFVPNMVAPTSNEGLLAPKNSSLPYPRNDPAGVQPYHGTSMSVFEHHPEVEGHKPFTEMDDDESHVNNQPVELDSDADSDFTSVSQRAPNPSYNPPPQQFYGAQVPENPYTYRPGGIPQQFQGRPQFVPNGQQAPPPQFYQNSPQYAPQAIPQQPSYYPAPQRRQPTVSDNVLSNNPDFALGGPGGMRRNKGFIPPSKRAYGNSPSLNQKSKASGPYGFTN